MVDSVLIVGKEQERRFRFGLGVNVPYAMAAAVQWFTPPLQIDAADNGEGKNSTSWLFHFDSKNILVTWWQPFFESQPQKETPQWAGVEIRLRETEGRTGKLNIRCPRSIASAEQVNFAGELVRSLAVAEDDPAKLNVEFGRFDYFQIRIRWKI